MIIDSKRSNGTVLREFLEFRELLFVLTWRDITVKYKQMLFGLAWILLRPFLSIVVFTIVFGKIANLPSVGDVPYALLSLHGPAAVVLNLR